MNRSDGTQHRPEIDGLRAFAILPVVFFHAGLGFPGGFVGVDIFFVISGFLITGIILRELDAGTFSMGKFWLRRIRRILPALLFFLGTMLLTAWAFFPAEARNLARQTLWMLAGLSNVNMLSLTGGYFAAPASSLFLLHTWSLAVEEQFYLLMPLILVLTCRWSRRGVGAVMLVLFVTSIGISWFWARENDAANFYLLPSRAGELLLGCLGAWAVHAGRSVPERWRSLARGVGLAAIVGSVLTLGDDTRWPTTAAFAPTLGALLILMSPVTRGPNKNGGRSEESSAGASPYRARSTVEGILTARPLRTVGLISYSVYLWHWPLVVYLKEYGPINIRAMNRWEVVAGALVLGAASWKFVEQPFRNKLHNFRLENRPLVIGAATVWACEIGLAALILTLPARPEMAGVGNWPGEESFQKYDGSGRMAEGGLSFNAPGEPARCVVLGSSHGMMLGPVVEALSEEYHVPCAYFCRPRISGLFITTTANAPADRFGRREWDNWVKKYLTDWKPGLVIIGGRWYWEMMDRQQFAATNVASFENEFSNTVHWMAQHGWKVVVVGQVPELPFERGANVKQYFRKEYRANGNVMPRWREDPELTVGRRQARELMRQWSGSDAAVIDPDPVFNFPDHSIRYYGTNGVFYADEHHINAIGAMELKPLLEPYFRQLSQ